MDSPLISVIVPAYNNEKTIEDALESMMNQTYKNLEIIVIDDFSTDNTAEIVNRIISKDKRVRLIRSEYNDPDRIDKDLNRNINAGYSARNTGFKHAKGQFITFQDADDASLLNRIEIQYELLNEYNAHHVTLDWFRFDSRYLGKKLDFEKYKNRFTLEILGPEYLMRLARKTKGTVFIPFKIRRMRVLNKIFFGDLDSYPGTGNSPLFRREVIEKVVFRNLNDRSWPSFMGRGADRDFNFNVAQVFKNSYVFFLPLYMWRQDKQNARYTEILDEYIIN